MNNKTFYFVAHPRGDKTTLTVIDVARALSYERNEFDAVNDIDFDDHNEAIDYARVLASVHDLKYEMFDSRYNEDLNEKLQLILE